MKRQMNADIASFINKHLKRFELDQAINKKVDYGNNTKLSPFYMAGACASGSRIFVTYVAYQGSTGLKREDAVRYLAWLDAGNVGQHWKVMRETTA